MALLAERELLGYPGTVVQLHVESDTRVERFEIQIHDPCVLLTWRPATRAEAKEMYFHPFCYGYEASELAYVGEGRA